MPTHRDAGDRPGAVRSLGPLEEFFWRSGLARPITVLLTAVLEGDCRTFDWHSGARRVQAKYEHFRVMVMKEDGRRPTFVRCDEDLSVDCFQGATDVEAPLRLLDDRQLGYTAPLLARFVVVEGVGTVQVTLAANHALLDGRAAVSAMEDFLAAASGEVVSGEVRMAAGVNSYFDADGQADYQRAVRIPPDLATFPDPTRHIVSAILPPARTLALRNRARAHGTTVQGALVAAFALAGRRISTDWRGRDLLCFSPIDLRPLIEPSGNALQGLLIGVLPVVLRADGPTNVWDLASAVKGELTRASRLGAVRDGLKQACAVVGMDGGPTAIGTIDPDNLLRHDLMVTNYGARPVRSVYGRVRLLGLFPAVSGGRDPDPQTISAITTAVGMCLTHQSYSPKHGLLHKALGILIEATSG